MKQKPYPLEALFGSIITPFERFLRQTISGWGDAVVERLAHDLGKAFPGLEGFSPRNIWRMRAFFLAWSGVSKKLTQAVSETKIRIASKKLPQHQVRYYV